MRRMLHHLRGGEGRGGEGRGGEGRGGEGRGGEGGGGGKKGMCVKREHPLHSSVLTQFLMTLESNLQHIHIFMHSASRIQGRTHISYRGNATH